MPDYQIIRELEKKLEAETSKRISLERKIEMIYGSITWKTGRIVLWPVLFPRKIIVDGIPFIGESWKRNILNFKIGLLPVSFYGPKLISDIVPENRNVVYTVILGDYDNLKEPETRSRGWDYICFTDRNDLYSDTWKIVRVKCPHGMTLKKCAGFFHAYPFRYLKQYELSVLAAGMISIHCDLNEFVSKYLPPGKSIALSKHPDRNCIYDEAQKVKVLRKDTAVTVDRQMRKYREKGYPRDFGLIRTGIMIRRHDDKKLARHCRLWLKEIVNHSQRDQLSFNYILWKYKLIDPFYFPQETLNSDFKINKHNYKQKFKEGSFSKTGFVDISG